MNHPAGSDWPSNHALAKTPVSSARTFQCSPAALTSAGLLAMRPWNQLLPNIASGAMGHWAQP